MNELDDSELKNDYGATIHCTRENLELLAQFFLERIISRSTLLDHVT